MTDTLGDTAPTATAPVIGVQTGDPARLARWRTLNYIPRRQALIDGPHLPDGRSGVCRVCLYPWPCITVDEAYREEIGSGYDVRSDRR